MKKQKAHYKKGLFDYSTLTVKFGGEHSSLENTFIATAIKVPTYEYQVKERADAGGGCYYGYSEIITKKADRTFLIFRDSECIGWMFHPYVNHNIKTNLLPIDENTPKEVLRFLESQLKK